MPSLAEKFATNLRVFRAQKKMSQEAVAQKVGVSVSYVSMLERGQRSPPLDMVDQFATKLKQPAIDFLK